MQRQGRFEPQRVARSESTRDGAALEHTVPEGSCVLRHDEDLAPRLTGVTGAVHHALNPVDRSLGERELLGLGQIQPLDCAGPLDCEQRVLVGGVAHIGAADLSFLEPAEVHLPVGGVHDQQIPERLEPVDDQIVDDPAAVVRQERVLRLARADLFEIV